MKRHQIIIAFTFALFSAVCSAGDLFVLAYHDVVQDPGENFYAVSRANFVAQMDYLDNNGYQVISLKTLDKIRRGDIPLAKKTVILTFDDGLMSYYDFVVPMLKIYKFPSIASIVTAWQDGRNQPREYLGKLMTWAHVKEISQSPLVEILSHTHNLHQSIQSNSQGNVSAASVTRQYLPTTGFYENEHLFILRINEDFNSSINRFVEKLGYKPIGITWPYGKYDKVLMDNAHSLGMHYQLSLDEGPTSKERLPLLNRTMVFRTTDLDDFSDILAFKDISERIEKRFVEIELDPFAGKSDEEQEELLSGLLDRLQTLRVNTIIVSPFVRGNKKSFFTNRSLEVETDILNRVLKQISDRTDVRYLYIKIPSTLAVSEHQLMYRDLARLNRFNGVVVDKNIKHKELKLIKKVFDYFYPGMRYGVYGMPASIEGFDYAVLSIAANSSIGSIRNKVSQFNGLAINVFVKVDRNKSVADKVLVKALRVLRSAGVKDYGYSLDNYDTGTPNPIVVAKELAHRRDG